MAELDFQTALLLQYKYEQEEKSRSNFEKSDEQLARILQEQYERENYVENATVTAPNLIYNTPKSKNIDSTKSLIDPSWELVDPTPDIHQLFVIFDKQFFWNCLGSVCVSWSKRMTSCAGICSYQGAGSICSITLSEPLLKLRPRKDLVETLLHEMIHAYLFVTANDRDRDGHGPEFHKHMYRINKEAGTKITVYHSFHDEVQLYKQHWWRCNGLCQSRPPYFGMVKRAMNRAPGPYDRWWSEHLKNCGGSFVKVKEPEKNTKKETDNNRKKSVKKVLPDIRKFLSTHNKPSTSSSVINTNSDNCRDFLSVRQHWQQKFDKDEFKKKRSLNGSKIGGNKTKIDVSRKSIAMEFVNCPVCCEELLIIDLDNHLDVCTKKTNQDAEIVDLTTDNFNQEIVNCLACNKKIVKAKLGEHLDSCVNDIFDKKTTITVDDDDNVDNNNGKYNCPYCWELIECDSMKIHIDNCLQNDFINSEFSEDF